MPPVLTPDGAGTYPVPVDGLIAAQTNVLLNDVALAAGTYTVDAVAGSIALTLGARGGRSPRGERDQLAETPGLRQPG